MSTAPLLSVLKQLLGPSVWLCMLIYVLIIRLDQYIHHLVAKGKTQSASKRLILCSSTLCTEKA